MTRVIQKVELNEHVWLVNRRLYRDGTHDLTIIAEHISLNYYGAPNMVSFMKGLNNMLFLIQLPNG